jgi:hypothetical protein
LGVKVTGTSSYLKNLYMAAPYAEDLGQSTENDPRHDTKAQGIRRLLREDFGLFFLVYFVWFRGSFLS